MSGRQTPPPKDETSANTSPVSPQTLRKKKSFFRSRQDSGPSSPRDAEGTRARKFSFNRLFSKRRDGKREAGNILESDTVKTEIGPMLEDTIEQRFRELNFGFNEGETHEVTTGGSSTAVPGLSPPFNPANSWEDYQAHYGLKPPSLVTQAADVAAQYSNIGFDKGKAKAEELTDNNSISLSASTDDETRETVEALKDFKPYVETPSESDVQTPQRSLNSALLQMKSKLSSRDYQRFLQDVDSAFEERTEDKTVTEIEAIAIRREIVGKLEKTGIDSGWSRAERIVRANLQREQSQG